MPFNVPAKTPSFTTNRMEEDKYWREKYTDEDTSSSATASSSYAYPHARTPVNGHAKKGSFGAEHIKDKIGDFLGAASDKDLPLYKDKPHFPSRRRNLVALIFPNGRRKRWLVLALVLFLTWWFASSIIAWFGVSVIDWGIRRDMVRLAFITSWEDYARYAWGKDDYSPISKNSKFMIQPLNAPEPINAGVGWIIVDALDTAMIMNCTRQVAQARKWIETSLDFGKLDSDISVFETTIRVLGGLLSAHYLSTSFPNLARQRDDDPGQKGEDLYIEKAVDLADRLLGAFDTASGIPYASVNLNSSQGIPSHDMSGVSSTAEATTLQLELKYVAKLTGEPLYWTMAERVMEAVDAPRREGGLVPIFIDPDSGKFSGDNLRLGSRGDSYYEYLIKQYLQTGETIYKEMWEEALKGIKRHMITWSKKANFTVLAERPEGLKGSWSGKMDHLVCFLPGTIALGVTGGLPVAQAKAKMGSAWGREQEENLVLAEELMKTCWGMYVVTPMGLAPEITHMEIDETPMRWNFDDPTWTQPRSLVDFEDLHSSAYSDKKATWRDDYDIHSLDVHNLQRPETVESLYYLWRITGNSMYRDWGWMMFKSFIEYTKVVDPSGKVSGYTSLDSVMKIPPKHLEVVIAGTNVAKHMAGSNSVDIGRDNMEGFWLAETLKYFYLLFSDNIEDEWFDLNKTVINTEAHLFPRFDITGHDAFKTGWTRKEKPRIKPGEPGGGGIVKGGAEKENGKTPIDD